MSLKRGAFEQGGKDTGIDTGAEDKASDPVRVATAAQMRARNIKQPRGRLHGTRSATPPNFALQAIGNPFSTTDPNTINSFQGNSTNAANKPESSAFTFGGGNSSTQSFPPSNNIENQQPLFGSSSQNNPFPSTQSNSGSLFGSIAPSTGFTFGNASNTTNPFAQKPTQAQPPSQPINQPASETSSPFKFGSPSEVKPDQTQNIFTQSKDQTASETPQTVQAITNGDTSGLSGEKLPDTDKMAPNFGNTTWANPTGSVGLQKPRTSFEPARQDPILPPPKYNYTSNSSPLNLNNGKSQPPSTNGFGKRNVQDADLNGDGDQGTSRPASSFGGAAGTFDQDRGQSTTPRPSSNGFGNSKQGSGLAPTSQANGFGSQSNVFAAASPKSGFGSFSNQSNSFGLSSHQSGFGTPEQGGFGSLNSNAGFGSANNSNSQSPSAFNNNGVSGQTQQQQTNGSSNPFANVPRPEQAWPSQNTSQTLQQGGNMFGDRQVAVEDTHGSVSMSPDHEMGDANISRQINNGQHLVSGQSAAYGGNSNLFSQQPNGNPFQPKNAPPLESEQPVAAQPPATPQAAPIMQTPNGAPALFSQATSASSAVHPSQNSTSTPFKSSQNAETGAIAPAFTQTSSDSGAQNAQGFAPSIADIPSQDHALTSQSATQPQGPAVANSSDRMQTSGMTSQQLFARSQIRMRLLNERFLSTLKGTDLDTDWLSLINAFQSQRDRILNAADMDKPLKRIADQAVSPAKRQALGVNAPATSLAPSPSKTQSKTAHLFESIVAQPGASNTPSNGSEQHSKPSTPPDHQTSRLFTPRPYKPASQGADLFAANLTAAAQNQPAATQASSPSKGARDRPILPTPAERRRKSDEKNANAANPFAKISTPQSSAPSSPTKTNVTIVSGGSPATGKKSKAINSDEDDLADYESSDDNETLEQELQRKNVENPNVGKSLFDRITTPSQDQPSEDSGKGGKAAAAPSSLFTQSPAPSASLFSKSTTNTSSLFGVQPPSDQTWKGQEDSAINFGNSVNGTSVNGAPAAPPSSDRPFGSLFGTPKPNPTPSLFGQRSSSEAPTSMLHPPTSRPSLFSGSASVSRATTPGVDASGASASEAENHEEDAEPKLDQSDLTAPTAEELRLEDTAFQAPRVRLMQFRKGEKSPYPVIGTGPLRLMQNKETGSTRIVVRGDPRGNVLLNATLQPGMTFSKMQKCVVSFVAPDTKGDMRSWVVKVGKDEVADNILRELQTLTPEES